MDKVLIEKKKTYYKLYIMKENMLFTRNATCYKRKTGNELR